MAKAKKGGPAATAANSQPKCNCDHPFQCDCGNRPSRPSKGHKWDPTTQTWGGKGHKQKGASGQVASSSTTQQAVVTAVGKTVVAPHQRLPSQLVQEYCQKQQRLEPNYQRVNDNAMGVDKSKDSDEKFQYRIRLPDPKSDPTKDLVFVPALSVANEEQAREEAALLALLHLQAELPHERKLPEPYRTTWLNSVGAVVGKKKGQGEIININSITHQSDSKVKDAKPLANPTKGSSSSSPVPTRSINNQKSRFEEDGSQTALSHDNTSRTTISAGITASTSSSTAQVSTLLVAATTYVSQAERQQQLDSARKERNARLRRHEAVRMANQLPAVFLSAALRKQVQRLLLTARTNTGGAADYDDGAVNETNNDDYYNYNNDDENRDEDELEDIREDADDDDVHVYVMERLQSEGFTSRQARDALRNNSKRDLVQHRQQQRSRCTDDETVWDNMYEECLQYLLIHLSEDDLPEGFDPRGRTLDVIVAPSMKTPVVTRDDNPVTSNEPSGALVAARMYGLSPREAALIVQKTATLNTSNNPAEFELRSELWQVLRAAVRVKSVNNLPVGSDSDQQNNQAMLQEELEALEAIYGSDLTVSRHRTEDVTAVSVRLSSDNADSFMTLEVLLPNGQYPASRPSRVLLRSSSSWPTQLANRGAAVHVALIEYLQSLSLGEPILFELIGQAQDLIHMSGDQLEPIDLLPYLGAKDTSERNESTSNRPNVARTTAETARPPTLSSKAPTSIAALSSRRRPRERHPFWTLPSSKTPAATAFPEIGSLLAQTRQSLPAARARSQFLSSMKQAEQQGGSRVILVTGETGSGKTTQIPQYILEEAPSEAKIVVAQPRRLAATGVASRVASERGEHRPGTGSIGYVVRGDSAICKQSRLVFCTTGVLLRQLQNDGALDCVTHIVVDEVHERQLDTDVLLGLLKQYLPLYPHLRVILMSATLDEGKFAGYWGSKTPRIHIPGRTFPVKDFFLEDVLSRTGYIPPKKRKSNRGATSASSGMLRKQTAWNDSEKSDNEEELDREREGDETMEDPPTSGSTAAYSEADQPNGNAIPIEEILKRVDESEIDYDLIGRLVKDLVNNNDPGNDGSILVFLPGAPEINKAMETIKRITKNSRPISLLPLHGGLQPKEQNLVFKPADKGFVKVVLSTNVAETSVTIPDCTIVIDTAREKQSSYDPVNRMPLLVEQFVSKASAKQRRGRAGRVRAGICYRLISRRTFDNLREHSEPEIQRCALDQTLLSLLYLGVERGSGTFMQTLLDPPSRESLTAAVLSLEQVGAVCRGEHELEVSLTPLGVHLAAIPAPPLIGKMLIMGSILGCREAALAMAAAMSGGRSPFLRIQTSFKSPGTGKLDGGSSFEKQKQQNVLKERAALFASVGHSDHALMAAVYKKWNAAEGFERKRVCESLGLSYQGMQEVHQLVRQLGGALDGAGFVASSDADRNSNSWRMIRTCAVASLAPGQLVKVIRPATKYIETAEGAKEMQSEAKGFKFFIRIKSCQGDQSGHAASKQQGEERVFIHPSSANFSSDTYRCPWLVYFSLVRTSTPFLRDATECSAYAILLFGGALDVQASKGIISVDNWVQFSANARIGALVGGLRERMDSLLTRKVSNPSFDLAGTPEMKLIVKLIMTDGLGV